MLVKLEVNIIQIVISKALIDLNISHDEFILINNMLKEYANIKKKEIKKLKF